MTTTLFDLASTIRSKNAGVDNVTFDIIFADRSNFERVRDSQAVTRASICELLAIDDDRVVFFGLFEPANAIKFTVSRLRPSGSPGETDMMGSQQYAPLFDIEIP